MAEPLGLVGERGVELVASISLRSSRAQALACGSVALTGRMKSCGSPFAVSYRLNASNGLARITPAEVEEHCVDHGGRLYDDPSR